MKRRTPAWVSADFASLPGNLSSGPRSARDLTRRLLPDRVG